MGTCATKPKVLKGEEGGAPQPVPKHPGKEETVAAEAKDVAVVDQGVKKVEGDDGGDHEVAKVKEIVEDGKAEDQENKPRSLSNLFKETEEGQDSTEPENAPSEPVKEESKETEKPEEEPVTKQPEAEKSVTAVEPTSAQEFVDALEKSLAEKSTDVTPAETKTEDVKCSETKTEGAKSLEKKIEEEKSPEKIIEVVKSPEKKTEEAKSLEVKTENAKSSEKQIDDSQSSEKKTES